LGDSSERNGERQESAAFFAGEEWVKKRRTLVFNRSIIFTDGR
jgi:hypothetical protein